jgi:hypothetical protein
MDKIFEQEELYWLDDILPGTKIGRIRRLSIARNVHIPEDSNNPNQIVSKTLLQKISYLLLIQPTFDLTYKSSDDELDVLENTLPNIVEVGLKYTIA